MKNIYEFEGIIPVIHPTAFIHPEAIIIGQVIIGENVYVGAGAVIRGDWGEIIIKDGCNVQETCVIHMFPGVTVTLMENAHIGHGAILHGCTIGKNSLVGMNSVVMDNVVIGDESIVGALTFIPGCQTFPARKIIAGNPAKILKDVSDEMLKWKTEGTLLYQQLARQNLNNFKRTEPLTAKPNYWPDRKKTYKTWKEISDK